MQTLSHAFSSGQQVCQLTCMHRCVKTAHALYHSRSICFQLHTTSVCTDTGRCTSTRDNPVVGDPTGSSGPPTTSAMCQARSHKLHSSSAASLPQADSVCLRTAHGSPPPEQPDAWAQLNLTTGKMGACSAQGPGRPTGTESAVCRCLLSAGGCGSSLLSLPGACWQGTRCMAHTGTRPHTAQQRPGISSPLSKAKFRPSAEVFLQIISLSGRAGG